MLVAVSPLHEPEVLQHNPPTTGPIDAPTTSASTHTMLSAEAVEMSAPGARNDPSASL